MWELDYILKVFLLEILQSWLCLGLVLGLLCLIGITLWRGSWELRTLDFYTIRKLYFVVFVFSLALGGLSNWCVDYIL